jgi:predicted dehydrogenase
MAERAMESQLPRICFFGCGEIAARHARTLKKLFPKIPLFFASRESSKAQDMAAKLGGSGAFGEYAQAAQSDAFDISFLATPHAYHAELAVFSANHGKDLIIEKPATRTSDEFSAIQRAVEENGVRCTVAENYYFKPVIRAIRCYIEEGMIGTVLFLELTKTDRQEKTGWRTDETLMGGGALLEGGVHWLNALTSMSGGHPKEVIAAKPEIEYSSNIPFEDSLLLVAKYSNGVVGRLLHSWRIPNRFFGMGLSKIFGTDGVITFESNGLWCSLYGKKKKKRLMDPREFLGFRPMHRAFVRDWIEGRPWEPSMDRIGEDLRMVWAAYRSLESDRFERV